MGCETSMKSCAVRYLLNNSRVTWLTRLSVHWADKMVATRSWKGLSNSSSQWAVGYVWRSLSMIRGMRSFVFMAWPPSLETAWVPESVTQPVSVPDQKRRTARRGNTCGHWSDIAAPPSAGPFSTTQLPWHNNTPAFPREMSLYRSAWKLGPLAL